MSSDPHIIEWRRQSSWLFCRVAQVLWLASAVLICFKALWPIALYAVCNATAAYMIARMNADMVRHLEAQPAAVLRDRVFYIVRRSVHCGHTFLLELCKDVSGAEHMKSMSGGEIFPVDGQTILAWYQQAIGRELK